MWSQSAVNAEPKPKEVVESSMQIMPSMKSLSVGCDRCDNGPGREVENDGGEEWSGVEGAIDMDSGRQ